MSAAEGEVDPALRLLRLLGGKWIASAIATAATLGLAEALAPGPATVEALARELACDEGALARLLAVLHAEGLVELGRDRTYALTPLGALLRRGEMGELSAFVGAPFAWDPWSSLARSVRTGQAAFEAHHGESLFSYLDEHPDDAALYHAAIDAFTRREARALAERFDFGSVERLADVGGGRGTLLVEVLARYPHMKGVLLERPAAVDAARRAFVAAGIEDRCEAIVGDFFEAVPQDVDACVIKHVLHNWDDARAIQLLRGCAEAVGPGRPVLVVEGLLLPGGRADMTRLLDLEMLALCGPGRERTKPEMRKLFAAAGLRLVRTEDLAGTTRLLVGEAAG